MEILSASLIGTICGFLAKTAYDYFVHKNKRKDKYIFSLLEKRFEVYQEANVICESLKEVVHDSTGEHIKVINNAREWYSKHHLYFTPETRNEFNALINDVQFYGIGLENYYLTCRTQGKASHEAQEKNTEIKEKWNRIMKDTQLSIESDLAFYYNKIK